MENAKIAIIEDNAESRNAYVSFLHRAEHQVVREACTLEEAIELINKLRPEEIDILLLDNYLSASTDDISHGELLARLLRERAAEIGDIPIIGISGSGKVPGVLVNFPKEYAREVVDYITDQM